MLVLRPGALGDTLLAVPALRALARTFGPLTLAAHGGAARLLAAVGEVEQGLAFDDPSLGWLFAEEPHHVHGGVRNDAAVRARQLVAIVAWMNSAAAPGLRQARLVAASRPAGEVHCARYLLDTLAPLGVESAVLDDRPLEIAPLVSDEVLIHPGSGAAAKNWPAARFAEVIRSLPGPVRLIVGEADEAAAGEVEACLGRPLPRLAHLPLEDLAARLAGCRGYLGNDSGVSHLAGLCGVRTVTMFGPTPPAVWRPLGARVSVAPFAASTDSVVALLKE